MEDIGASQQFFILVYQMYVMCYGLNDVPHPPTICKP